MTTTRGTGRPLTTWIGGAHQLVDDRPALAGVGLTDALPLLVSGA